jgi:hypothetical protein
MASAREIWNAEQIWRAELREGTDDARAEYAAAVAELDKACAQALREWWEEHEAKRK